eukprot:m.196757 g.196757  ORF g.196757 m.196757 type:complete len:424 (+) comp10633_c0_seq11:1168-2439(+)
MDTIFVHVGQCGNSVGHAFWQQLGADLAAPAVGRSATVKALLVDSETKVLRRVLREDEATRYFSDSNIVLGREGRGCNWAYGFHGGAPQDAVTNRSPFDDGRSTQLADRALDQLRHLAESCSVLGTIVVLHSLCGGTGSGLGSALVQRIRDEYPSVLLVSVAVAPALSGESPLQHYNVTLCLDTLQRFADFVVLFDNDTILALLQGSRRPKPSSATAGGSSASAAPSIGIDDMNRYIARALTVVLRPSGRSPPSAFFDAFPAFTTVCPSPTWKFCEAFALSPRRSEAPADAVATLLRRIPRYDVEHQSTRCLGALSTVSGFALGKSAAALSQQIDKSLRTVSWANPCRLDEWRLGRQTQRVGVVANRTSIVSPFAQVAQRATAMVEAGAYLHWYERYGTSRDDIRAATETVWTVVESYQQALA